MLNTQGVVTSRFFEQAYQERSTVGSIMARLGNKVDVQATTVSSPQLEMTSFATDSTVAPGTQFSLVLDRAASARGSRVRARRRPGTSRSRLSVEAQPGLVTRGAQYPPSEDYHFKPLERARSGLSAAVSDRAGRVDRPIAAGPGRIEGRVVDDDQRRSQLPGVRRQAVFHAPVGAPHVDGDASTVGPRARKAVTSRRAFLHAALAGGAYTIGVARGFADTQGDRRMPRVKLTVPPRQPNSEAGDPPARR